MVEGNEFGLDDLYGQRHLLVVKHPIQEEISFMSGHLNTTLILVAFATTIIARDIIPTRTRSNGAVCKI